jgi:hypothetical protein
MLLRKGMIVAMVAIATAAAGLASAAAQASQAPRAGVKASAVCARRTDQMSVSALRGCGYRVEMLRRVTTLPAGGKAYDYGDYTLLVPPAHFNPLKEPDRVLAAYGFPTRKRLGKAWYPLMRAARIFTKPQRYLVEDPRVHYNTNYYNWAGYDVNDHQYLSVETTWTEPSFDSSNCSASTQFAEWAGIGGIKNTQDLGQEGTTFNHPNWPAHEGFIETISGGTGDPVEAQGFDPAAGDSVYALVSWDASTSEFDYYMEDETTGVSYSAHSRVVTANLDTAEVVSERPTVGTTGPPLYEPIYADLSKFDPLRVQYAKAYWSTGSSGFYGDSYNSMTMISTTTSGDTLAQPGTLGSGSGFTVTWDGCS